MQVLPAIQSRYSVRSYQQRPAEDDKLERILQAARLAPSASNRQEWRFVVVRDQATRQELMAAAGGQKFVAEAPVVIAACAVHSGHVMACGQLCYPIDVAVALEHIALQAVEEGLGTCWIGHCNEAEVKRILGIPGSEDVRLVGLMTLGYPADSPREKTRLPLDEIVMYEKWKS